MPADLEDQRRKQVKIRRIAAMARSRMEGTQRLSPQMGSCQKSVILRLTSGTNTIHAIICTIKINTRFQHLHG